jgi:hypothetical protein
MKEKKDMKGRLPTIVGMSALILVLSLGQGIAQQQVGQPSGSDTGAVLPKPAIPGQHEKSIPGTDKADVKPEMRVPPKAADVSGEQPAQGMVPGLAKPESLQEKADKAMVHKRGDSAIPERPPNAKDISGKTPEPGASTQPATGKSTEKAASPGAAPGKP